MAPAPSWSRSLKSLPVRFGAAVDGLMVEVDEVVEVVPAGLRSSSSSFASDEQRRGGQGGKDAGAGVGWLSWGSERAKRMVRRDRIGIRSARRLPEGAGRALGRRRRGKPSYAREAQAASQARSRSQGLTR